MAGPVAGGPESIQIRAGERFTLLSTAIPDATRLGAEALARRTRAAYLSLLGGARRLPCRHLFRVWNLIPGILQPLDGLAHRYLAFNTGRHRAYREWYGEEFHRHAPTASGVGAQGDDLVIHALAAAESCRPLQNPRQRPSHRYSEAYGPCPPCFARAVLVSPSADRRWLVVGGTASVRGEETMHAGDLEAQTEETLVNLATLVDVALVEGHRDRSPTGDRSPAPLDRFRSLRVYYVDPAQRGSIAAMVEERFSGLRTLEYVRTELCRDDLLIEIEGVAELDRRTESRLADPS